MNLNILKQVILGFLIACMAICLLQAVSPLPIAALTVLILLSVFSFLSVREKMTNKEAGRLIDLTYPGFIAAYCFLTFGGLSHHQPFLIIGEFSLCWGLACLCSAHAVTRIND